MNGAINFYDLKTQLSDLGFYEPTVVDQLRAIILSKEATVPFIDVMKGSANDPAYFNLYLDRNEQGQLQLTSIECAMRNPAMPDNPHLQYFHPDVPAAQAIALLQADRLLPQLTRESFLPLNLTATQEQIHLLKTNTIMNKQKLEALEKTLLNLGFGEQVNAQLEKNINKELPEFTLAAKHEFNQQKVDYTLHFKAGDEQYFFNKFDATLNKGKDNEQSQTFYINRGNGITAKEAFNLMEGRAVYKQLYNREGEGYHAWLQLDNSKQTENGNKEIKRFNENYGFDLDAVLKGKGIKELTTPEGTDNLFRSLKKGNSQQITVERNGEDKKYFIAASPQFKTVDLYDHQMKKIKREELLQPEQKQTTGKKQSEQQKEDAPAKKQSRKNKMQV